MDTAEGFEKKGKQTVKHVVMNSGGIGFWAAGKRVAERHGTENLIHLFTDTLIEHPDLYRFLKEGAENIGGELVWIADGRTPFEVFRDERFLGNSRIDPCSKILKRNFADKWLRENCNPADTICYVGIDWSEIHRFDDGEGGGLRARKAAKGWRYEAPMTEPRYMLKSDMILWARTEGLTPSESYKDGFPHDNCGGGCIKAGQAQWALLLRARPAVYARWEGEEESLRELLGDVSILTEQVAGVEYRLPLKKFRERIQANPQMELAGWGGCGCFMDEAA
jgi:hypothetical protein